jgi:predicted nicotinamide N-methyase
MDSIKAVLENNTYWEEIRIVDNSFMIQRVKDIDALLDVISVEEFNKDERLPYWADIWPSAIALSEYIAENKSEFKGKKILELGCGLGLVGITATASGGDVLFTDNDPYALRFTGINFRRNFEVAAAVQILDWRNPGKSESFDIILAADILYERRWLGPVIDILDNKMLSGGIAIIAGPDRKVSRAFHGMIEDKQWTQQSMLKRTMVYDKLHKILINRITKC